MKVELDLEDIESLLEAVDCLKTKIAFTKGLPPSEKNQKLRAAEGLEKKLEAAKTGCVARRGTSELRENRRIFVDPAGAAALDWGALGRRQAHSHYFCRWWGSCSC